MMVKVFVDGQEGTTGLQIRERLSKHAGVEIMEIEPEKRKDPEARRRLLNASDLSFLCLPDSASRESVSLVTNDRTRIIDASTAHRTDPNWTYGLPELNKRQRPLIKNSLRVSVPGCHATGFILLIYPLVSGGIIPRDYPVTCHSITGYSGGGKKLIGIYESMDPIENQLTAPRHYALGLNHKHLPEMQKISGLDFPPIFTPIVSNFYKGMAVFIPLFGRLLPKTWTALDIHGYLSSYFESEKFVKVQPFDAFAQLDNGFFSPLEANDSNRNDIFVFGDNQRILLVSRLDNLGKGASGAAVQNMNIMLGMDEAAGLE